MNHNQNTFVISVGEHLAAITYAAPWMNNQPINYAQAYLILSAVHEELFNEMFSWAKIDNSVEQALHLVYQGFEILVQGKPKLFKRRGHDWEIVNAKALSVTNGVIDVEAGARLPRDPQDNVIYRVHGVRSYSSWIAGFVDHILVNIKSALRIIMQRHMGTSLNYEWWYEYVGNGIMYTRQKKAVDSYVQPELPESEQEYINSEINLMRNAPETAVLDITRFETAEGWPQLQQQLPAMIMSWYSRAMERNQPSIQILVKYHNPANLCSTEELIKCIVQRLPIPTTVQSEQIQLQVDLRQTAKESMHRHMTEQSIMANNRQLVINATVLTKIRDRIVRRNRVSATDIIEIDSIDQALSSTLVTNQELYDAVNNRVNWYKFNNVNPAELDQTVVGAAIALSNYIDMLNGNVPSNTPIPVYKVRAEKQPLAVIPLYGR